MKRTNQRQIFRNAAGQSLLEFALLAPLLLGMVFSVIEIGRYWGARQGITNAAREGARVMLLPYGTGAKFGSQGDVNQAALVATRQFLNMAGLADEAPTAEITPIWYDAQARRTQIDFGARELARGDQAGVRITYQFETPLKLLLVGGDGIMTIRQQVLLNHE
jgi:Flp pilus assembly protein TadG